MAKTNTEGAWRLGGDLVAVGLLVLCWWWWFWLPSCGGTPATNGKIGYVVLSDSGIYSQPWRWGQDRSRRWSRSTSYSPDGKQMAYSPATTETLQGPQSTSAGVVSLKLPTPPIPWLAALLGGDARGTAAPCNSQKQWTALRKRPDPLWAPPPLPSSSQPFKA